MTARTNDAGGDRRDPMPTWRLVLALTLMAAVGLALVGALVSVFLPSGYMPFSSMISVWEAPRDGEVSEGGDDTWLVGDSVVRSRFDGVSASDIRSGKKRWEYLVPDRAETCATNADTAAGVALIAYRQARPTKEKDCASVAAVDLSDGRELWRTVGVRTALLDNGVATGGGLGVLFDGDRLRAVDLKTGTPRWTAPLPKDCGLRSLGLAPEQVVAALSCGTEATLAAFDLADGKERWTTPLDARRGVDADAELRIVSADPPTVQVDIPDEGPDALHVFGSDGRHRARIATGDYSEIVDTAVEDGRLFVIAQSGSVPGSAINRVIAFDLASGGELWRKDVGDTVDGLDATDGRVTMVRPSWKYGDSLHVLDAGTGDEEDERDFRGHVVGWNRPVVDVLTYQDLVVVVRKDEEMGPFTVYERW